MANVSIALDHSDVYVPSDSPDLDVRSTLTSAPLVIRTTDPFV